MSKGMELNTVVFNGDYDSMKSAFSRSVLGVTYKKFKRKGAAFYKNKTHNEITTRELITKMYYILKEYLPDLIDHKIKANYILEWDNDGKILSFKDIKIDVFLPIGMLSIGALNTDESIQPIKIDVFLSQIDLSSRSVKKDIFDLKKEYGDVLIINEYDILTPNGKLEAELRKIDLVPTIIVHDELLLQNPDKTDIQEAIKKLSNPKVYVNNADFTYENSVENNAKLLIKQLSK